MAGVRLHRPAILFSLVLFIFIGMIFFIGIEQKKFDMNLLIFSFLSYWDGINKYLENIKNDWGTI